MSDYARDSGGAPLMPDDAPGAGPGDETPSPPLSLGHPLRGMTDPEIARVMHLPWEQIRRAPSYRPGLLASAVHDPSGTLERWSRHPAVGGFLHGVKDLADAGMQFLEHTYAAVGGENKDDLALGDALRKIGQVDFAATTGGSARTPLGTVADYATQGAALPSPAPRASLLGQVGESARVGATGSVFQPVADPASDYGAFLKQKGQQLITGGAAGALLTPLAALAGKGASAVREAGEATSVRAQDALRLAQDARDRFNIPMTWSEAGGPGLFGADASHGLRAERVLERTPWTGLHGFRVRQQDAVRAAVNEGRDATIALARNGRDPGKKWGTLAAQGLNDAADAAREKGHELYNTAADLMEKAGGRIQGDDIRAEVAAVRTQAARQWLRAAKNPRLDTVLEDIEARLYEADGSPRTGLTMQDFTDLRNDLADVISEHYTGPENAKIGKKGVHLLMRLDQAVQDEIEQAALSTGDRKAIQAVRVAKKYWERRVVPYHAASLASAFRALDSHASGLDPNAAFTTFLSFSSNKDAQWLYNRLTPRGRQAIMAGIVERAVEAGTRPATGTGEPFVSPTLTTNALHQMREMAGLTFTGKEGDYWKGLENILRHVPRAGQYLANAETGQMAMDPATRAALQVAAPTLGTGAAVTAAVTHPEAVGPVAAGTAAVAAAGATTTTLWRWLITDPAGHRALAQMARLRPGSRAFEAALRAAETQASRVTGTALSRHANPDTSMREAAR